MNCKDVCHFLRLPLELRNLIYELVVTVPNRRLIPPYNPTTRFDVKLDGYILISEGQKWEKLVNEPLIQVSMQVLAEVVPIFYRITDFLFSVHATGMLKDCTCAMNNNLDATLDRGLQLSFLRTVAIAFQREEYGYIDGLHTFVSLIGDDELANSVNCLMQACPSLQFLTVYLAAPNEQIW